MIESLKKGKSKNSLVYLYRVTVSLEKIFYREKEHSAIFICTHFMWGS